MSLTKSKGTDIIKESDTDNSSLEKIVYDQLEPLKQEFLGSLEDESDLLAFLPSINTEQTDDEVITTDVLEKNLDKSKNKSNKIESEEYFSIHNNSKAGEEHNHFSLSGNNDSKTDQVILFFEWLQNGIKSGELKPTCQRLEFMLLRRALFQLRLVFFRILLNYRMKKTLQNGRLSSRRF